LEPVIGDLDELTTTLWHLAHGDAESIRRDAESRAEQKREQARGRAEQTRDEILRKARAEATQIRLRRRVRSSREQRRNFLEAREELLQEVWQAAEKRLRELTEDDSEYASVLERLAVAAGQALGGGTRTLASDESGRKLLTAKRLKQFSRSAAAALDQKIDFQRADDPIDTWGGLVVRDEEKARSVDMTFAARLRLAAEEIRGDVYRELVRS
jgi:V-type H+-transporting ATPase subunit E